MPLVIPPGYWSTDIEFSSFNFEQGTAHVVLGWLSDGILTPVEIAEKVHDALVTNILPVVDGSVTLSNVTAYDTDTAASDGRVVAGAGNGELAPPNIALLTKKLNQDRGPRAKGRSYWPGILLDASLNQRGEMTPSDLASYQTRFDDFLVSAGPLQAVILGNSEGISPQLATPPTVTQFQVQQLAATQRRRLR